MRSGSATHPHTTPVLITLLLAAMTFALAQTLVVPALPEIGRDLNASTSDVSWVLTAFLLSASVSTPLVGKLGDLFGKGRVLTILLVVFAAGSVLAATSESIEVLILARAIQGTAAGVFPLSFGIIRDTFPPERVAVGIGFISAMFGIGGGIGLPLSGLIVDNADIGLLFWIGLMALPVAVVAYFLIPPSPARERTKIDWAGALVLSLALVALLLGITNANEWGWESGRVIALVAGGLLVLAGWVALEARTTDPLIDMRVLRERAVAATNLTGLFTGFAMFASFLLIPQLVQAPESTGYGFGASVTQAGLFLLPSAVMMLISGPLAGWLGGRIGSRAVLIIGGGVAAANFAWLALEHAEAWQILVSSAFLGLGIAFSMASMANLVVQSVPAQDVGIATGINTIMRTIGGSLGAAVATAIVTADLIPGTPIPAEGGYTAAFWVAAVGALIAGAAALAIPRTQREGARQPTPAPEPVRAAS
jgi:EmrB/QacA subfamily drug resistance transporter